MADDAVDRLGRRLVSVVKNASDRIINNRVIKIDKEIIKLQSQFYTILVQKIINVSDAPNLGIYTPTWKPLTLKYKARKKKVGKDFYFFSGKLRTSLLRSKATTTFGKPIVSLGGTGKFKSKQAFAVPTSSGRNLGRLAGNRVVRVEDIKNIIPNLIVVDLYPKITKSLTNNVREGDFYSNPLIAYKLSNARGPNNKNLRDRNILTPYLRWWLNVKAKEVIRKAVRT